MRIKFISSLKSSVILLSALFLLLSCSKSNGTPDWEWPDPTPNAEKPRYIWIDAAANFPDFANSKENIIRDLTLAKNAGFTDVVVDIRPTTGDALFTTDVVDQVKWLGAWLPGGYTKIERTATWDYLRAFIDEGHKLGLKVHAGFNTMTGGNTTSLGSEGVLFRDASKSGWATQLNTTEGIKSIMNVNKNAKFFNPVMPEVQEYLCQMLEDLAAYQDLDGIFLDRGRFDGFESDFSPYTKQKFEEYIGQTVSNFPNSVIPPGTQVGSLPSPLPTYFKQWLEFRVKTIHDFMVKAKARIKAVNPKVKFGVYVGAWYSSYYDVGVNWASPNYSTSSYYSWASTNYKNFGYADHLDMMLIGAYAAANKVYGTGEWTMQGFCTRAKDLTKGAVPVYGGPDVGNWTVPAGTDVNQSVQQSVDACINACDGYFLFDMIHLKKANQWQYVKTGIDTYLNSLKK